MSQQFKTPVAQAESLIGKEVNIPYQKGVKGKIIDDVKDTYGVEYTTPKGITRQDRFYKNEFENLQNQAQASNQKVKNFNRQKYDDIVNVISNYRANNIPMEDIQIALTEEYGPDHEDLIRYAISKWAE